MSQDYTQYIVEHKANVEKAFRWIMDHNIFPDCEIPVNVLEHNLGKVKLTNPLGTKVLKIN